MRAVGIHVFAGGFTHGIQRSGIEVKYQLEKHGFGLETAKAMCGVECINGDWPDVEAELAYGNPRCTGFSTITSGYDDTVHGPWAKQTCDIHELCNFAAGRYDFVVWESVQQAASVGRPLLNYLRDEVFFPKHYKVAHLFLNAASFGNTQQRKRYFFVAYRDCYKFNVEPPTIPNRELYLYDAIFHLRDRPTHESKQYGSDYAYDFDSYVDLSPDEAAVVPKLPNGWDLNAFGAYAYDEMPQRMKDTWDFRSSSMPFSMHSIFRPSWLRPSPTIHSSASRWLHPDLDRPLTVGELATIMGWPCIPEGPAPCAQIAKGVCPETGEWLGQMVQLSHSGAWGKDDFESSYCDRTQTWVGRDTSDEREKTFNLTKYVSKFFDKSKYDLTVLHSHRFNVSKNDKVMKPWTQVRDSYIKHTGTSGRLNQGSGVTYSEYLSQLEG